MWKENIYSLLVKLLTEIVTVRISVSNFQVTKNVYCMTQMYHFLLYTQMTQYSSTKILAQPCSLPCYSQ